MNPYRAMDATPPPEISESLPRSAGEELRKARQARQILWIAMAGMIALPVLLFVVFHT